MKSYCADKVKFTDGWTDGHTDGHSQQQYWIPERSRGKNPIFNVSTKFNHITHPFVHLNDYPWIPSFFLIVCLITGWIFRATLLAWGQSYKRISVHCGILKICVEISLCQTTHNIIRANRKQQNEVYLSKEHTDNVCESHSNWWSSHKLGICQTGNDKLNNLFQCEMIWNWFYCTTNFNCW